MFAILHQCPIRRRPPCLLQRPSATANLSRSAVLLRLQKKSQHGPQPRKPSKKPRRDLNEPFDPALIETGWYKYWDSRGHFEPRKDAVKPPIRMLLPPPNVTGELHIGHALMLSIEDALARYYRMNSHPVIWAPGTDHAGIATQTVVERELDTQKRLTRHDLGREKFVEQVEEWRTVYGRKILKQMARLGTSTTNSHEYYTKDEGLSTAVTNAFVRLWEDGLIYRDTRMVNWSTKIQTAVSDIEVDFKEIKHGPGAEKGAKIEGAEFGWLHRFAFPVVDGGKGEEIVVSTTRPETIPGDRAVAVHPDDPRYQRLHYKRVRHPLIPDLTIPIIPDADLVDPSFGSGAVKITPAHDANDYAFWKRHSTESPSATPEDSTKRVEIPFVTVFNSSGKMTPACQVKLLMGQDRLHMRRRVIALLEKAGAYRGREVHDMRIPICSRTGGVIEPMPRPQWYLRMKPLAQKAKEVAERDGLKFLPETPTTQLWNQWLDGIQDWCLSRQIWWGHRIPAYRVIDREGLSKRWIAAETEAKAKQQLTGEERNGGCILQQDEDVLDTWFSSGLLPLSTAGWRGLKPAESVHGCKGAEMNIELWRQNYPLTFIESGGDILFFWIARMAMLSTYFAGTLPFPEVILHPLICDATGKKMSKSVGNVLDPLYIIDGRTQERMIEYFKHSLAGMIKHGKAEEAVALKKICAYELDLRRNFPKGITKSGADALRMALLDYTRQQRQINFELRVVDIFRKLAIKIDNAVIFYRNTAVAESFNMEDLKQAELTPKDRYIIHHTLRVIDTVDKAFQSRRLYDATEALREYTYDILCGVYIEFIKPDVAPVAEGEARTSARRDTAMTLLHNLLDILLRLLHPFMPFHSESLWQELLPETRALVDEATIMTAPWPTAAELPEVQDAGGDEMEKALELLDALRAWKGEKGVVVPPKGQAGDFVRAQWETLERLGKVRNKLRMAEKTEEFKEVGWIWEGTI